MRNEPQRVVDISSWVILTRLSLSFSIIYYSPSFLFWILQMLGSLVISIDFMITESQIAVIMIYCAKCSEEDRDSWSGPCLQ